MADAAVTAASVLPLSTPSPNKFLGTAGQACNAGDIMYQTNATNAWWFRANTSNALTAGSQNGLAFALAAANGAGQPVQLQNTGQIALGTASLVDGAQYTVSVNTGNIGSAFDRQTGQFDTYVGYALNTTTLQIAAGMPGKTEARTTNT